jgi:hypothetical protein
MTQKDNILQELKELNSRLTDVAVQNIYSVPAGYFDGLAEQVMARIRALEANNAADELNALAPYLDKLSREMPYSLPKDYFETLSDNVLKTIHTAGLPAKDELAAISPLLSSLKKENPYSVPKGYFESLPATNQKEEIQPAVKVVSLFSRNWFRYAAAAVVTGIIILAGLQFFSAEKEPGGKALAKFTRDVKKMDEQQKDDMIDFFDAGLDGKESAQINTDPKKTKEVMELLEGVSEEELKDFQEQTEAIEEVLMTN